MSEKRTRVPVLVALVIALLFGGVVLACILLALFGGWEDVMQWLGR